MKASKLIEALQLCKSSLLSLDFVPVLTHFCFTGKTVYAYNDITAVVVDLPSEENFLVHGKTFLDLVSTFDSEKEVNFESKPDSVLVKCGRSKIELSKISLSERKDFAFSPPQVTPNHTFTIEEPFVIALSKALETVLVDAYQRALMGVLFDIAPGKVNIYTSDNTCITWTESSNQEIKGKGTYLLSRLFCDQLLMLQGKLGEGKLSLSDTWAIASFNGATLYGKNMPETPIPLGTFLKDLLQGKDQESWTTNTSKLFSVLQRASIISRDGKACTLKGEGKVLRIKARGEKGKLEETLELKTDLKEIEIRIDPEMVSKALAHAEFFLIFEKGLIAFGNDYVRVVSTLGTETE